MSPQQTMKKRHEMIQETQEFLSQELDHRQESGVFYPRMQSVPQTMDTWHHSFSTPEQYYPHLQVKPSRLNIQ
jgi:hypothetical protein